MAKIRFVLWTGLLLVEASFVAVSYVASNKSSAQSYVTHPAMELEIEGALRESLWLRVAVIVFFGFIVLANIGFVIPIWRAFKELRTPN
jgi:hypothetical protein